MKKTLAAALAALLAAAALSGCGRKAPPAAPATLAVASDLHYVGEAIDCAVTAGFESVLLVGHLGKLLKVAGGAMNTHSNTADGRRETICAHAALCGQDFLKNTVSGMSYTGSYWLSAVPFAVGIACIEKMKKLDLPRVLNEKGKKLRDGLIEAGKKYGFDLHVSGMPSLFYLRLADDPSLMLHQEWIVECVKRGVFFTTHHNHFINYALSDADIAETIAVAQEAFSVVRERHPEG